MNLGQWYVSRGRITRRTFWLHYFLPILAVSVVAGVLDLLFGFTEFRTSTADSTTWSFDTGNGPIGLLATLATIVPSVSSQVTRLHDRGHSAWWLLFVLLPVVGWIVLIVQTGFLAGDPQPNRYGPPQTGRAVADPGYPTTWS
jgi:uncharacterized membrane protein YhaH (DUF805 family)